MVQNTRTDAKRKTAPRLAQVPLRRFLSQQTDETAVTDVRRKNGGSSGKKRMVVLQVPGGASRAEPASRRGSNSKKEASMRSSLHVTVSTFVFAGMVSCALAQDGKRAPASAVSTESIGPALTGKERLGRKWTDEQRIDNCRVPINWRGAKPRPSACSNDPAS
jgi:hypothetical protein